MEFSCQLYVQIGYLIRQPRLIQRFSDSFFVRFVPRTDVISHCGCIYVKILKNRAELSSVCRNVKVFYIPVILNNHPGCGIIEPQQQCNRGGIGSFLIAFTALLFFVKIPEYKKDKSERVLVLAKEGLTFLKKNQLILTLILFMSGINFVASAFDAVLPGYVLPNPKGGSTVLGIVTSCSGAAMIVGSLAVSVLPKPKNRVRVIYLTMLFSLGTENFLLAFSREPLLWCIGQFIGWVVVPIMSANLDVILRTAIPVELQGRVYACRNTLQFFTIPIGLFVGGFMVDQVCEPFMGVHGDLTILKTLFGTGKGSGAALMMLILGINGSLFCIITGKKLKKY